MAARRGRKEHLLSARPREENFFLHGGANFPNLVQETRPFPERIRSLKSSIE
jgi:hypothetical protein